jgi:hypothetical protein
MDSRVTIHSGLDFFAEVLIFYVFPNPINFLVIISVLQKQKTFWDLSRLLSSNLQLNKLPEINLSTSDVLTVCWLTANVYQTFEATS